jgi:hypothetical protein
MHHQTEFNAEIHYRQREYNSYWIQCIQQSTANIRSSNLSIGYYSLLPEGELNKPVCSQPVQGDEIPRIFQDFWPEKELLNTLALQEADLRLERFELNYLSSQLIDKVDHYTYLDQDSKLSQDLRWALLNAKEKERLNPKRQELLNFRTLLAELCEELIFCEYTLKLTA